MNILFLSLIDYDSISESGIYTDLLREFVKNGHKIYMISPVERRNKIKTFVIKDTQTTILKLKIGNVQKTNMMEKGISTIMIQPIFIYGIQKFFSNVTFDLILYTTPPITFFNVVKYVKKRDHAYTYLLLKDIFPQNAVDLGVLSKKGLKGMIYKYFRNKEKRLYDISDKIGCMSPENVNYLRMHNTNIHTGKAEVCPNAIEVQNIIISEQDKKDLKEKYNIPLQKMVFLYGGNLGRPQGLNFFLHVLKECVEQDCFFLIVGDGTEYQKIQRAVQGMDREKVRLIRTLPKEEYEKLVQISDVGLVFLNVRFTVPNIPSRILSYMQASLPVLAATDENTDLRQIIEEAEMGFWCRSGDTRAFLKHVQRLKDHAIRKHLGENARAYLEKHYHVKNAYKTIISHFEEEM